MCEICKNWARDGRDSLEVGGKILIPNHNPTCPRYNDSLMDVWKVSNGTSSCYLDNPRDAADCLEEENLTITQEKMHREVFNNLPEFDGF